MEIESTERLKPIVHYDAGDHQPFCMIILSFVFGYLWRSADYNVYNIFRNVYDH